MLRYFLEVSYKGTNYAGFQIQKNAITIQSAVELALATCCRKKLSLTGSSRTDKGVHALQNFFHFDSPEYLWQIGHDLTKSLQEKEKLLYSLNSVLPEDIVIRDIYEVPIDWHCRFTAISRQYRYRVYQKKNPFLSDVAFYFPYKFDIEKLQQASQIISDTRDFTAFSKRNTQVNNFFCSILESNWSVDNDLLSYTVTGNRFLRGMVRGLVGTMLKVGTGRISIQQFHDIVMSKDVAQANFAVAAHGLFLVKITYPEKVAK